MRKREREIEREKFQLSHEGVSEMSERAREWSERSEVERCGASERSEG